MAKQKPNTVRELQKEKKVSPFPFFITGLIFIVLSLFISFAPDIARGWGFNYIKYFSPWVIVLYYLLLLCFWLPPVNKAIVSIVTGISRKRIISSGAKYKYLWFVLISIAFGFIFYLLKIKYIFLGDLDLRARQIEEGFMINDEYLTMLFFKHAQAFLHAKMGYTGIQTIQLFDYITGALFIFISLCTSNLIGNTFLKKLSVFVVGTLSLTILLQFCGYTEIYAFPVLFLNLYLFACILNLKGKVDIYLPFLVLLTGVAFHLMLVCMFPSFVFLFYRDVLWKHPVFRKKSTIIALLLISSPFIYIAVNKFALPKMMAFSTDNKDLMTMFSLSHFKEFFNSQVLASGIGFFIWLMTLLHSLIDRIKYDATQWFLFISSLSIVGLMFVFDPHRGSGDWDILAFAAVVYNLSNAYYLISLHDKKMCNNIKYGILMISGFSVLHTSMWIATNKTDASAGWVERAFEDDPGHYYKTSFNNEAMLALMFGTNGLEDKSIKWHKIAYNKHPNDARMGYNYANELLKRKQANEAITILESMTNKFPQYPLPYPVLVNIYIENKDYQSLYNLLLKMEAAYNKYPDVFNSRLSKESINQYFTILNNLRNTPNQ
ncbi:MAG: hypothetical protein LBV74_21685 [Tannerella sp.]|jgi:hypothetical protein|nr:hypothetical protein [Tannerella sp.]